MKEMTFKATIENTAAAVAFVESALEEAGCPMKMLMQINVAMDEVFVNIASYAYAPGEGDATIRFELDEETHVAQITLIDQGVAFDPLNAPEPDITKPAAERPIGGLGIFLVRKLMDEVTYERKDGCNILTLRKKI